MINFPFDDEDGHIKRYALLPELWFWLHEWLHNTAHMGDNRNPRTEVAVVVEAKERLTSRRWVLLSFPVLLAHFHSLYHELSFMVGNTSLDKAPPRCSVSRMCFCHFACRICLRHFA